MAWTVGKTNPVILYPAGSSMITDYDFTAGSFGATAGKWQALGGTTPTLVTGENNYAVNFAPVASDSFIYNYHTTSNLVAVPSDGQTNQMYVYVRLKAASGTGSFYVTLFWYDAVPTFFASNDATWAIGTTVATDSTYRTYRVAMTPNASAVYYGFAIGARAAGTTFDATLDWVYYGHALDGQDMNRLNNVGTMAVHPFRYGSTAAGTFGSNVAGKYSARRFHSGYRSGNLALTTFASGDVTEWGTFIDYCADGTPFTMSYNQSDWTRDAVKKAVLNMDSNGLEQVAGSPYWRGSLDWKEVP